MYIDEQIALRMARDRIEDAVRAAEWRQAVRPAGTRASARIRLGTSLVRLGHWILGQPSPAPS